VLTQAGYLVVDARDGDHALVVASEHPTVVDLLITDVVMPGLTGRELASRLADAFPSVRVLYTSGYAQASTRTAGIAETAPFLAKPFLPAELVMKVKEVLGGTTGILTD
jgi:DNA-binding response OmpR family regulator